jgi:hypothetical protein
MTLLKDPLAAPDPYDLLAVVGITPQSTMQQVLDASFDLMETGRMNAEMRAAWDTLRTPHRRLLVDLLRYPLDLEGELAGAVAAVEQTLARWGEVPFPAGPEATLRRQLDAMSEDEREIPLRTLTIELVPELDFPESLIDDDFIRFDR